jgi:epidermal growth factor receptor substrate 15
MSKSFAPSPQELALVGQIFARVDKQKLGILTGDVAVEVFQGSHLPAQTLGEIWQLADSDNQGFLTRKGVAVALRLIGHAQKGETVTAAYANKRTSLNLPT